MAFYPIDPNGLDSRDILPMLRDLYSRRPGAQSLAPWGLQRLLWSLGYVGDLIPVAE
jgi:hypothetical protein